MSSLYTCLNLTHSRNTENLNITREDTTHTNWCRRMSGSPTSCSSHDLISESGKHTMYYFKDEVRRDEVFKEFVQDPLFETHIPPAAEDIDTKYEEIGYGHSLNSDAGDHRSFDLDPPNLVDCVSVKSEQADVHELYLDLLKYERGCETCEKYILKLSKHVRATHAVCQTLKDPLFIDPLEIDHHQSSVTIIETKCDGSEDYERLEQPAEEESYNFPSKISTGSTNKVRGKDKLASNLTAREHFQIHKGEQTKQINLTSHKRPHTGEKKFRCDVCEKCFSKSSHLIEHKRIHTGEKPFKCDVCENGFQRARHLTVHKKIHDGEIRVEHVECEKSLPRSADLTSHMKIHIREKPLKSYATELYLNYHKRLHTGEKMLKCDECQKSFPRVRELIVHKRIHTGERPFKCDECGKGYKSLTGLTVHKRTHSGLRPFKCDECEKSFKRNSDLAVHKVKDTGLRPFKCDECSKTFAARLNLKFHKKVHSGERPFMCDVCRKRFAKCSHLKEHTKVHTGERPFKCGLCEKSYQRSRDLTFHKTTHTNEKSH